MYSAVFEASEATGLAPHAIQGVIRLLMVVALAHAATRVAAALMRSAGIRSDHPALLIYPIILAATLVANGGVSPLVLFPFLFVGSVVFALAVALVVARDRDMQRRRLQWYEPGAMALLGAAAAMTYDLVYVAPVLAAVFIAARALAAADDGLGDCAHCSRRALVVLQHWIPGGVRSRPHRDRHPLQPARLLRGDQGHPFC